MIKITTYDFLSKNSIAFVLVRNEFKEKIKNQIQAEHSSLKTFSKKYFKMSDSTLKNEFRISQYLKFDRLMRIANILSIQKAEVYDEIKAVFARGSSTSKRIFLPKELNVDESFVEGYALYLAEGDNGSNGRTKPRKLRFTNSNLAVHKLFIDWLKCHFPGNYFYFKVLIPQEKAFSKEDSDNIKTLLRIEDNQIRTQTCRWKRKTGFVYRTCLDSALVIDLILEIENKIKDICRKNKKLAAAYIRGMMVGEGTAYFNRSRYVRIEMKNQKEIEYLHKLFILLGFKCEPSVRAERDCMWSIYIGAKQLKKYNDLIGFGVHVARQKILNAAVDKKLRKNQFG